jgi:hypothetical protein
MLPKGSNLPQYLVRLSLKSKGQNIDDAYLLKTVNLEQFSSNFLGFWFLKNTKNQDRKAKSYYYSKFYII